MRTFAWTAASLIVGAALGWLLGRTTHPQTPLAQPAGPLPGVEAEPPAAAAVALFAEATPSPGPAVAAEALAPPSGAAPAADVAAPPAAPPSEILVIPHGPGRFAALQLAAAGQAQLPVYQGSMVRDGLANPPAVLRAPKIATLRGDEVRVELLHLGFDRDAQPVAAHVRLVDGPAAGSEGIVLLRLTRKGQPEVRVPLRPLPAEPAAPPAEDPQN